MQTPLPSTPFLTPPPKATLTNTFAKAFDNSVAAARTCYAPRVIGTDEVSKDERARATRDRIARETYTAGHHTTLQHAHFQFAIENVSRQLLWSFLHAHPFYNSEQVSQRYVEVRAGSALVPSLPPRELALYQQTLERQFAGYHALAELLLPAVEAAYFELFPGRRKQPDPWKGQLKKRAQEVARYVLPIATFAHLYHTVSGLTLHRYHRLSRSLDLGVEQRLLIDSMVEAVSAQDPLFFRDLEDPLPIEATPEFQILEEHGDPRAVGGAHARDFAREFDRDLGGWRSKLVDYAVHGEETLAQGVRSSLGLTRDRLSDDEAIARILSPSENLLFGEALTLTTLSKSTRALSHPHYTFKKKLSHSADSQDQRHRMTPASRPVLSTQYAGGEPDAIVPDLIQQVPQALELFEKLLRETFDAVDALLDAGVQPALALYLLPNAFPVRFEESGDLLHLHHKWTSRLCYTAQEEIWRTSVDEVKQVRQIHPRIGKHLMPPCSLRAAAGVRPTCPEGRRFCGVPVWRLELEDFQRTL
jgi:thymidylate synthase ThyX